MKCAKKIGKLCKCCRLNNEERHFKKAKSMLRDETDIVVLLKRMRRFEQFMHTIISFEGVGLLKEADLKVVCVTSSSSEGE